MASPARATATPRAPSGSTRCCAAARQQELGKLARIRSTCRLRAMASTSPENSLLLAVVGAHLTGQPLNRELTELGAVLSGRTTTAARYRMFALATEPPK